jgi:hypothetical protein
VLAAVLLIALLPGRSHDSASPADRERVGAAGRSGDVVAGDAPTEVGGDLQAASTGDVPASGSGSVVTSTGAVGPITSAGLGTAEALAAPDCDRARARLRVSSIYAPPCAVPWPKDGDNGGSTTQGVTATTIKVVAIHDSQSTTDAQRQGERESWNDYVTMFEALFRTWGRKVETTWFVASGTDEAAQRADAIRIAAMKPFAVLGAGVSLNGDVLVQELASRKVLVCCYTAITRARAQALAPYLWGTVLSSPEAYELNLAQYAGRRLVGKPARWAGQTEYKVAPRKFGLIYPDTWTDLSLFQQEFARYGGQLAEAMSYVYDSSQYAAYQERASTMVAKMKKSGITTVLYAGGLVFDPVTTKAATSQQWFPEWVIAGTGGQDLDIVGRLNDPLQWQHAFGISSFAVGGDKPNPLDQLYEWYWGPDRGTRSVVSNALSVLYFGIHGAGPRLAATTFRDALFAYPPSGGAATGGLQSVQVSFGRHGIFPWDDYNQGDDYAEVFWDPQAQGKDSLSCQAATCAEGVGKYRFLNGGRRYAPGSWPMGEPAFFKNEGTVLWYSDYPAADRPPSYPCNGCPSSR